VILSGNAVHRVDTCPGAYSQQNVVATLGVAEPVGALCPAGAQLPPEGAVVTWALHPATAGLPESAPHWPAATVPTWVAHVVSL
jgi:hypothetical protein